MSELYKKNISHAMITHSDESCIRRDKLLKLRNNGIAFPNDFRRDVMSDYLHKKYDDMDREKLRSLNIKVKVAGRMMSRRIMGQISFVTLQDMTGIIQLYVVNSVLPKSIYDIHFKTWDIGDILGASGYLFKTHTGELSVYCAEIRLLTKSLRVLPEKFHGLSDQEIRYRKRYLDLITNHKVREVFRIRSLIMSEIRKFMLEHDFMEVETPMMQTIAGGAIARPFVTHHNSLDIDIYLRISPEIYLKKLVIGGFEKIFEINRNFRNEGISSLHNPEFTMMEIYIAYVDYKELIILIENLLYRLSERIFGSSLVRYGDNVFDFSKPFIQMTMHEAICRYCPNIQLKNLENLSSIISVVKNLNLYIDDQWGLGKIQTVIFEKMVEKHLIQPTCITNYPTEVSPLARPQDKNPFFSDRFEIFIAGREIGNGFSELNDSEEQKLRFLNQAKHVKNNDNFLNYDEDYIIALEYGLPPTAGVGIGIDRLVMLFTDQHSIRDVILFPTLRPIKK